MLPDKSHSRATAAYVAPFLIFVGVMTIEKTFSLPGAYWYPLRFVLSLAPILLLSRRYVSFRPSAPLASVLIGIAVLVIWVAPDQFFGYRHHWLFENSFTGKAASSLPPDLQGNPAFLILRKLVRRIYSIARSQFHGGTRVLETMQETLQGIRIVKAFTLENIMRERFDRNVAAVEHEANKMARVSNRASPLMETLGGCAIAMAITYGGYRVIETGATPGQFFSFIAAFLLAAGSYLPTLARYRRSPLWAFALPLIALFYMAATVGSAFSYWLGRGASWKKRDYGARTG